MNRRKLISAIGKGSIALTLPLSGLRICLAQTSPALGMSQLAPDLYLLSSVESNVLVSVTEEGLLLVDGGSVGSEGELYAFLQSAFEERPISVLFNTHWHLEQTGLNDLLGMTTKIIAHENTRLWMTTEIISKWQADKIYLPRDLHARPNQTFYYNSEALSVGGVNVEYGYLPQGHTDGDIYVYFPEKNVMAAGGVVAGGIYPVLDYSSGGWLGGMISSLQILLDRSNDDTIFVPAQGTVQSRQQIQQQHQLCLNLIQVITQNYYAGATYEEFLATRPLDAFEEIWTGDADRFLQAAYESAWGHVTELRRFR